MTGQNGLGVPACAIQSIWAVALAMPGHVAQSRTLFDSSDALRTAWTDLSTVGELRDVTWRKILEGMPDLERMRGMVELPREQRIEMLDVALRVLASARPDSDEMRSFLAGYFTSLLAPGSLDHAEVLVPIAPVLPTAYLWYGLCASVNARGEALPAGNALARRIVRDLTIPDRLVDRPRCDVALEELALFGPGDNLPRLTAKAGRLDIDILPGVTTAVRWPPHDVPNEDEMRRMRDMEMHHLLAEMEDATMRSRHLTERLRDMLRIGDSDRSPDPRRKRGGKTSKG